MKKEGISQEGLKLLACITMLADHIGAVFFPGSFLRIIGRLSFPIYCFLLTEGIFHTSDRRKYGIRLLIGALLAEIPFDLLFFGGWYWEKQNVMVSLLLGYLYCLTAQRMSNLSLRIALMLMFACLAEFLCVDYGCWSILMIGLFFLTKGQTGERLLQVVGLAAISLVMSKATVPVGGFQLPLQAFAVVAMIPICGYDGRKVTANRWIQRVFYLFYPVHLLVLYLISKC